TRSGTPDRAPPEAALLSSRCAGTGPQLAAARWERTHGSGTGVERNAGQEALGERLFLDCRVLFGARVGRRSA
ncbi:MAG: hypothetical protein OXF79_10620, partial [Chloroflexi bacterium]|nr:hypothetical protein [Chloroflexota bacterium]